MPWRTASDTRMQIDYSAIWEQNTAHFLLGEWSLHGPNHWRNVELNGLQLCQLNGADETVVRLFAVFHDVERHNEGHDPDHGRRAADLIETLHGDAFQISPEKLQLLLNACRFHNDGKTTSDITIGTCWDADRLDLGRVGITPHPSRLCTEAAKNPAMLKWADGRGCFQVVPELVKREWGVEMEG